MEKIKAIICEALNCCESFKLIEKDYAATKGRLEKSRLSIENLKQENQVVLEELAKTEEALGELRKEVESETNEIDVFAQDRWATIPNRVYTNKYEYRDTRVPVSINEYIQPRSYSVLELFRNVQHDNYENNRELVRIIGNIIARKIRWTSDMNLHGSVDYYQPPRDTLSDGRGDCIAEYEEVITSIGLKQAKDVKEGDFLLSFDFVKKSFEEEGFRLLSTEYVNAHNKLKYECSNGHELTITWAEWNSGHGHECRICKEKNKTKEMLEFISNAFEKEGYKLLTTKYINSRQKLDYICPKGNKHTITWNMWQQGKRCPCCNSRSKKTIEFVVDEFAKEGYIVKSEFYENNKQKIMCVCPNGHEYSITRANWMTGYRCPKCNLVGTSKQEIELIEFIKSFGIDVIEHDRSLISPYELDIIIPAKKVAIEYCGLYWHSELAGKDRNYHLYKLKACKEKGYRLITIFEDELLYRKEVVFSRLKNIFRVGDLNVIYARNCVIDLISTKQARIFCEERKSVYWFLWNSPRA